MVATASPNRLTEPGPGTSRRAIGILAFAFLAFVVYGSLVPLDYTPIPWDEAVARFRNIRFLELGIGSRADWVANLLLFIPLTFLWIGWLWPRSLSWRLTASLGVWVAAVALSLGIEFTQLFFPPRTVSQNDIFAESIGGLIGIGLWWWTGPAIWSWIERWREARGVTSVAEYLLWAYLAGMFFYNVLPLDLTISPVEIYHKWKAGGVNLIPFAYPMEGVVEHIYAVAVDAVLWVPVSLLWVVSGRRSPVNAFWWTLAAALLLEVMQFFVYSRVSDVTDLITAAVGGGVGAIIGARLPEQVVRGSAALKEEDRTVRNSRNLLPWTLLGVVLWTCIVCSLFWYPFEFEMDREFLRERIPLLTQVPFQNYYFGTEFRAVTEVFHKVLFLAPLGALLGLARIQIPRFSPWRAVFGIASALVILGVPLLIELGQVAMPEKHPDSTDWFLMVFGAAAGFVLVHIVRNKIVLSSRPRPAQAPTANGDPP
jgi:glycopeptide antibiotics resistance protein